MSNSIQIDSPYHAQCELGEGVFWNAERHVLSWVDIDAGLIHEADADTGDQRTITTTAPVGFAVPIAGTHDRVAGIGGELWRIDGTGACLGSLRVESGLPSNRINDGKADPAGRVWFGTMALDGSRATSALYRLDAGGLHTIANEVSLSNGLDWDVARERMYYIDTRTGRVDVFDYDVATGDVHDRRTFAVVEHDSWRPDGLTLDADGNVWFALFGGGVVRGHAPDGAHLADIALPVTCPTCPAFGGDDLATMYVTTSRHKLDAAGRAAQPLAGYTLAVTGVSTGLPGNQAAAGQVAALA